jgi:cytoskeletal protein CcmA (bactofilin family)
MRHGSLPLLSLLLLLALLFSSPAARAVNYIFPINLPAGCSGSGGNYTCGPLAFAWGDTVRINPPRPATITINGDLDLNNVRINTSGSSSNLNLRVNGNLSGNTSPQVVGHVTVTGNADLPYATQLDGSLTVGGNLTSNSDVSLDGPVTITGNATLGASNTLSSSISSATLSTGNGVRINGDITTTSGAAVFASNNVLGADLAAAGSVTLGSSTTLAGNLTASGHVTLASPATVSGNLTATGTLSTGWGCIVSGNVVAGSLSDGGGCQYGGNITTTSGPLSLGNATRVAGDATAQAGAITMGSLGRVAGNLLAQASSGGTITLNYDDRVSGCVMTHSTASGSINLAGWQARAGGVCCVSGSTCLATSNACYANTSGASISNGSCLALMTPSPVLDYRMDEAAWTGASGEVADQSGNGRDGVAVNGATTTTGKLCNGGSFNGSNHYLRTTGLSSLLNSSASLSFWIKTTQTGNNTDWEAPGVTGVEQSGGENDIFWGWLNGTGRIGLSVGNAHSNLSTSAINGGTWRHVVLTRDAASGAWKIYLDGSLNQSGTGASGTIGTSYSSIGRIEDTGGSPTYFSGMLDELKVFSGVLTASQIATIHANEAAGNNWDGSTRVCPGTTTTPSGFNAVDVGANPVNGRITTKTAGSAFNLDLYALNAAGSAQDTSSNATVLVDLLANTATGAARDGNGCPTVYTALAVGSFTLAAGKATASMGVVDNAWRDVRVRIRYPATGPVTLTRCSSDNFAVKPASLAALASHANWTSPGTAASLNNTASSGGTLHKAGQPFTLRVTGYNASGVITSQYDGSPGASITCLLPASGCVPGTLTPGSFSASAGTLTSTTARYSEAGAVAASFTDTGFASVDSNDTAASCAGYYVCTSSAVSIGRFVPDHFDISANTPAFLPGCGSFTYLGQPFGFGTRPRLTVTAKNQAGITTVNYTGSLWKLTAASVTGQSWSAASGTVEAVGTLPGATVTDLGAGSGRIEFDVGDPATGAGLRFVRSTPAAPANASLTLAASVADSEGVTYAGNPYTLSGIGFDDGDAGTPTDAQMRFGRLRLINAFGSEFLALSLPLSAQYWNGQGFVTNTLDYCTPLTAPTLTFYSQTPANQLASGETTATHHNPLVAGQGNLRLSAPGTGNYGYLDLTVTAPAWLRYNWDGTDQGSDGDLLDDNPRARASFGKRNTGRSVIIRRETY